MANDYTQTSFSFTVPTKEHLDWLEFQYDGNPPRFLPPDTEEESAGFMLETDAETLTAYIYEDEFADIHHIILFLQAYLRRWEPQRNIGFTYAFTCSKPRVDAFSGGAIIVDANDVNIMEASHWLQDQLS